MRVVLITDTPLYNTTQIAASKTIIQLHLFNTVSTKTEYYNLHEGRIIVVYIFARPCPTIAQGDILFVLSEQQSETQRYSIDDDIKSL